MPGLLTNDMPGTPGAISQMLGLLMQQPAAGQPGQPAPAPVAPMAMQAPNPMEHVEPAQSLLGKIHDFISDRVGIREPGGYRGLLSDEEIQQAKPGILASGAGDSWREKLDSIVKMKQFAAGLAEANRIKQVRSEMPQNLDLPGMLKYAAQHGDVEMIKSLGGPLEGMLSAKPTAEKQYEPKEFQDAKGNIIWVKPGETPPLGAKPYAPPVREGSDRALVPVQQPDGTVVYAPRGQAAGQEVPGKGTTGSAQNMAAEALLRSSVSEMTNADTYMRGYEGDLVSGKKSINGLAQFMGSIGNSFTHDDPASRAVQSAALFALNKVNPDLARYIRRGLSFAEGEAGISKRPSDFRTKMAAFLSTVSSGADHNPGMVSDIQGRRSSILTPLHEVLAGKSGQSVTGGSKTKLTQAQYDAGRKKHSDAEIAQHYDLAGVTRK